MESAPNQPTKISLFYMKYVATISRQIVALLIVWQAVLIILQSYGLLSLKLLGLFAPLLYLLGYIILLVSSSIILAYFDTKQNIKK